MLDIKLVRENPKAVKANIKKKFQDKKLVLVDKVLKLDKEWRELKFKGDKIRSSRNKISEEINSAKKKKDEKTAKQLIKKAKEIPAKVAKNNEKLNKYQKEIKEILIQLPNMISKKTPIGKDESKNKVLRKHGKQTKFTFPIKNHVELAEQNNWADFDISGKVAGSGFYYLKGDLALLNQALIRFAIDFMNKKKYSYIEPPLMLNDKALYASMDKEAIEESVYTLDEGNTGLIGTAEQPLLAMHTNQDIIFKDLPKKYFAYSMCFRKEVGSHGINEKGLWRTHQFNKVEQFIFCKPEESEKLYDELLDNSEEMLKKLDLPYRVLEICTGDLADWKYRSADLEVWRPTIKDYGETGSLSNCTDYQARKLNIRIVEKDGTRKILHTLNNTALATSRIIVTILENFQQKDGSVKVPRVLQPYMDGKKKLEANLD
jgi:seryl-tRNA synthetase